MPEYIGGGPATGWERAMYWGLGLLMVAFLISVPFMIQDKQERLEKAWQDQGCRMYDEKMNLNDVPVKCKADFIEHYQPQQPRLQPPDER